MAKKKDKGEIWDRCFDHAWKEHIKMLRKDWKITSIDEHSPLMKAIKNNSRMFFLMGLKAAFQNPGLQKFGVAYRIFKKEGVKNGKADKKKQG